MDIEEDSTINNGVIIERTFVETEQSTRIWSCPKTIKYPTESNTNLDIIKKLLESKDIQECDIKPKQLPLVKKIKTELYNTDSGVSSLNSFSDNVSIKSESIKEQFSFELDEIYLVPNGIKWIKAKLVNIDNTGTLHLVSLLKNKKIQTNLKMIAYAEHPDDWLKFGSRVIALVASSATTGEVARGKKKHQLGVVAEAPKSENKNRYLIILDDGRWVYTKSSAVKPLVYQNSIIWVDLPKTSQKMVRDFITGKFEQKIEFKPGDQIPYCLRDKEYDIAHVLTLDASIVIYWSNNLSRVFSIHKAFFPITKKYLSN